MDLHFSLLALTKAGMHLSGWGTDDIPVVTSKCSQAALYSNNVTSSSERSVVFSAAAAVHRNLLCMNITSQPWKPSVLQCIVNLLNKELLWSLHNLKIYKRGIILRLCASLKGSNEFPELALCIRKIFKRNLKHSWFFPHSFETW